MQPTTSIHSYKNLKNKYLIQVKEWKAWHHKKGPVFLFLFTTGSLLGYPNISFETPITLKGNTHRSNNYLSRKI